MITYPAGKITRYGEQLLLNGDEPSLTYQSPDGGAVFHLMGPFAPIPGVQEGVIVTSESIKGMIPSWSMLDQQGANQPGVTFNDAVYDPAEIDMVVEAHGNTIAGARKVVRDWISSWDAHKQGELAWFTKEQGLWWAPVRWMRAPTEQLARSNSCKQRFLWTARIDDAFWRSYDSVSTFRFDYNTIIDEFKTADPDDLGTNYHLTYSGEGGGYLYVSGGSARWKDDPGDPVTTSGRTVVAKRLGFNTSTDNQVVELELGSIPEVTWPNGAFNDVWGRMGETAGEWNGTGIRARVGWGLVRLTAFVNHEVVWNRQIPMVIPPLRSDRFTLVCGYEGNPRMFKILRNGFEILSYKENGTASQIGSAYRGAGFGMRAGAALLTQATPATVWWWKAGVNTTVSQSGYVQLANIGDQPGWHRFLVYGPGDFSIANGPDSTEFIKFGRLEDGQIALLNTEPRIRGVVDLSPSSPGQSLSGFQQFIKRLVSFATNNNVPPLLRQFESEFGILPPQGALYPLLKGRFTNPIPPKSPSAPAVTHNIAVRIDNGNANSKIVAALTPLRRWPI